jgi:hypothetical protein
MWVEQAFLMLQQHGRRMHLVVSCLSKNKEFDEQATTRKGRIMRTSSMMCHDDDDDDHHHHRDSCALVPRASVF